MIVDTKTFKITLAPVSVSCHVFYIAFWIVPSVNITHRYLLLFLCMDSINVTDLRCHSCRLEGELNVVLNPNTILVKKGQSQS